MSNKENNTNMYVTCNNVLIKLTFQIASLSEIQCFKIKKNDLTNY